MRTPNPRVITDLASLPVLLTLDEVAAIYRLQPKTIRNQMFKGTFEPKPFLKHPYRWRRDDIVRHLAGPDIVNLTHRPRRRAIADLTIP